MRGPSVMVSSTATGLTGGVIPSGPVTITSSGPMVGALPWVMVKPPRPVLVPVRSKINHVPAVRWRVVTPGVAMDGVERARTARTPMTTADGTARIVPMINRARAIPRDGPAFFGAITLITYTYRPVAELLNDRG